MTDSKQINEAAEENTAYKLKLAKKLERRQNFVKEMNASSTFGKMWTWLKHKWFDSILFWITIIITGSLLIVAGRILWEVAKMVFSL